MNTPIDDNEGQVPAPARGLLRQWNRTVLFVLGVLPAAHRRRLGWWRWDEVSGREYGEAMSRLLRSSSRRRKTKGEGQFPTPVYNLWKRGLLPDKDAPMFPGRFTDFRVPWDRKHWMELPEKEFKAWAKVCKEHPKGEGFLENLLMDLVAENDVKVDDVKRVLDVGANPAKARGLLDAIFNKTPRSMEDALSIWGVICYSGRPLPSWEDWASQRQGENKVPRMRTAHEMEIWKRSGLPMPTGRSALLHALAWVYDPPLFFNEESDPDFDEFQAGRRGSPLFQDTHVALEAIRWFREHADLPASSATPLLRGWLCHASIGSKDEAQRAATAWLDEFFSEGLPPRPAVGPDWFRLLGPSLIKSPERTIPWSHWLAQCSHFDNIPPAYREKLFSEPDAWTAVNGWGEDTVALYERRLKDVERHSSGRGIEGMRAWVFRQALHESLPDAQEGVSQVPVALPARSRRL